MKILILGDPSSPHIIKWVRGLSEEKGIDIYLFGLSKFDNSIYSELKNFKISSLEFSNETFSTNRFLNKSKYLKSISQIKKIIKDFKPDIIHSHYATSYGLLGALTNFYPFIISVWGTDVYDFPNESKIKKMILKYNLAKADFICSTSYAMAKETQKYTDKNIKVIAFGIDTEKFKPQNLNKNDNEIVIGTIKTLEQKYGIEYLIKAFSELKKRIKDKNLKLLIVGGGSQENYLKNLVRELNIENETVFTDRVNYDQVINYYNKLDIYVALSLKESFGVAIIEASSCEKPVIVSNVGGLPEVVVHEQTGFIVEKSDYIAASHYLEQLILNDELRKKLGENGRKMVQDKYDFSKNLEDMINVYKQLIEKRE